MSRFIFGAAVIGLACFGAAFLVQGYTGRENNGFALLWLGSVVLLLALVAAVGWVFLLLGKPSGPQMLTTMSIIAGIPVLIRGTTGLMFVALAMIIGAVLLWLPSSRGYFKA